MEKSSLLSNEEITPSPAYPYPYPLNFSKVEGLTYLTLEGENAIDFYIPEGTAKFVHLYVVANYIQVIELPIEPKMFFIDQISETTFKVEGIRSRSSAESICIWILGQQHFERGSLSFRK